MLACLPCAQPFGGPWEARVPSSCTPRATRDPYQQTKLADGGWSEERSPFPEALGLGLGAAQELSRVLEGVHVLTAPLR